MKDLFWDAIPFQVDGVWNPRGVVITFLPMVNRPKLRGILVGTFAAGEGWVIENAENGDFSLWSIGNFESVKFVDAN